MNDNPDVKSEFFLNEKTGQRYVLQKPGGKQSPNGDIEVGVMLPWSSSELSKNRNIAAASTTYAAATNDATWIEADNVTQIEIVSVGAATAQNLDDMALIIYDGLNEAAVLAMFADAGGIDSDVEYKIINLSKPYKETFTSYLTKVSVLPLGADTRFVIQAQ